MKNRIFTILILLFVFSSVFYGQFFPDSDKVSPVIKYENVYGQGKIVFKFDLPEDNHITDLKNGFFNIEIPANEFLSARGITFPEGVLYGEEMVFKGRFEVTVYVDMAGDIPEGGVTLNVRISYQICREKPVEVCYPPDEEVVPVLITENFSPPAEVQPADASEPGEGFAGWIEKTIKTELGKKSLLLFLLVFLGGFLTSFTPCVYPVIPIIMGYVGARSGRSKFKGFYLSVFFILGLALVYSLLGIIAAMTGSMLGVSFQNPLVVFAISTIFILMGLSLAGFFEIPVPSSISSKVQKGHKSEIIGALVIGGVAGIIAAPCVGPVLVALLSWISQTGNVFLGFLLTFTFSLGLGVIFLLAGTFSGVISSMPKGGKWMDYVKYLFSILLIGGGLYFLGNIISKWLDLVLWGIFLIAVAVFSGIFRNTGDEIKNRIFKVFIILVFISGVFLFVKGLDTGFFGQPAAAGMGSETVTEKPDLPWLSDLETGRAAAAAQGKTMMIDTYAEWCVACKELEKYTFSDPEVAGEMKKMVLVKLDFTEKNERTEETRKALNVIGMPTVIFMNPEGKEIGRFSGFIKKDRFLSILNDLPGKK